MADDPATKQEVKEIVSEAVEELAGMINRGFTDQQEQIGGLKSDVEQIKGTLVKHSEMLGDQGHSLGRIEGKQDAQQKLIDYHDREIERLLKHQKLEPSALEE